MYNSDSESARLAAEVASIEQEGRRSGGSRGERSRKKKKNKSNTGLIIALFILLIVGGIFGYLVGAPILSYKKAVALYEQGSYKEALIQFSKWEEFQDSQKYIADCLDHIARESGIKKDPVTQPTETVPEETQLSTEETQPESTKEETTEAPTTEAPTTEAPTTEEPTTEEPTTEAPTTEAPTTEAPKVSGAAYTKLLSAKKGDTVTFGHFEQDNNLSNGQEPIEWRVLNFNGSKMLLLSKYILYVAPYDAEGDSTSWKDSGIRDWLNGEFKEAAFNADDKIVMHKASISNDGNELYGVEGCGTTKDWVFLLSYEQAVKYFYIKTDRVAQPTAYAKTLNPYIDSGNGYWWLRDPGSADNMAMHITYGGSIDYVGELVSYKRGSIRPAIWIDLAHIEGYSGK